jgi:hypothetical protein
VCVCECARVAHGLVTCFHRAISASRPRTRHKHHSPDDPLPTVVHTQHIKFTPHHSHHHITSHHITSHQIKSNQTTPQYITPSDRPVSVPGLCADTNENTNEQNQKKRKNDKSRTRERRRAKGKIHRHTQRARSEGGSLVLRRIFEMIDAELIVTTRWQHVRPKAQRRILRNNQQRKRWLKQPAKQKMAQGAQRNNQQSRRRCAAT